MPNAVEATGEPKGHGSSFDKSFRHRFTKRLRAGTWYRLTLKRPMALLTLIPDHGAMDYPRMLAAVTRALNASGREKMLAASSPREIMRILNDKP